MFSNIFLKWTNYILVYIYKKNVKKFGFTPRGLFWNSKESQENRFKVLNELLLKYTKVKNDNIISIADIGCGYGDFYLFLKKYFDRKFTYKGYDINIDFINFCKNTNKENNEIFFVSDHPLDNSDFSIMNGTYNYAVYGSINKWEEYLIYNLKKCFENSNKGIIFSLQNSTTPKIVNNIYYTSRFLMENKLKEIFKNVYSFYFKSTPNDVYFVILRN